jgi:hypothetical protein
MVQETENVGDGRGVARKVDMRASDRVRPSVREVGVGRERDNEAETVECGTEAGCLEESSRTDLSCRRNSETQV